MNNTEKAEKIFECISDKYSFQKYGGIKTIFCL
jgi:hypothetical protein